MNFVDDADKILLEIELKNDDKFKVIECLLDVAVDAGLVDRRKIALQDLLERERYLSTGFEHGLAVPHAKSDAVTEMVMVFGLHREGVNFDSLDGQPARFIFLLLSPMDTSGPHIQTLALLARNFQDDAIARKLIAAETEQQITEVFNEFK